MRHQSQGAVLFFDERSEALHPVAVVGVDHAVALEQRCPMDMPADDAIQAAATGIAQTRVDESRDVALGGAALALEEFRQRPVAQAGAAAQPVEPLVAGENPVVQPVAEFFLQVAEMSHGIVVVAMDDQQASAIRSDVDRPTPHTHGRHRQSAEVPERAIMIAGDIDDLGAGPAQRMQAFDHPVFGSAPVRAALSHPPQIDDVADQIQPLAVQPGQEIRQFGGVAVRGAQMQIGQEHRAPSPGGRCHAAASRGCR